MAEVVVTPPMSTRPITLTTNEQIQIPARIDSICSNYLRKDGHDEPQSACRLLLTEMLGALRFMGYADADLHTVAARITSNLYLASCPSDAGDAATISRIILDDIRKIGQLNSNEPVLLISVPKSLQDDHNQVCLVKRRLLAGLREFCVSPVRVYVCVGLEGSSIHLALLNVVNTDIGGPSMIQLLDCAFHGDDWKRKLLSKEAWHGNELLWRDEIYELVPVTEAHSDQESQARQIEKPVEIGRDAVEPISEPRGPPGTNDLDQNLYDVDIDHKVEALPKEHPAMRALNEDEDSRPYIEHPTWIRDTGSSSTLLDIITTQSQSLSQRDSEPLSIISQSREEEEEEFELVDP